MIQFFLPGRFEMSLHVWYECATYKYRQPHMGIGTGYLFVFMAADKPLVTANKLEPFSATKLTDMPLG